VAVYIQASRDRSNDSLSELRAMGGKKKDVIEEIEEKVNEFMNLHTLGKTIMCDPSKNNYVSCVVKKAYIYVEMRKRRDKLIHQLSFGYVTGELQEKEAIEEIINAMIQIGLVTESEWMKAVNDALRYLNRIDGVDTRERIRRVAENIDKVFEEGLK